MNPLHRLALVTSAFMMLALLAGGCTRSSHIPVAGAEPLCTGLPIEKFPSALSGLYGYNKPAWHHFTVSEDSHEFEGLSFFCDAGSYFALFRDGTLDWIAEPPFRRVSGSVADWEELCNPLNLQQWALAYHQTQVDPLSLANECVEAHNRMEEARRTGSYNAGFIFLLPIEWASMPGDAIDQARFRSVLRTLDGSRIRLGAPIKEALASLPAPAATGEWEDGILYSFGGYRGSDWGESAPVLHLFVRDGRVVSVLTVHPPPQSWLDSEDWTRRHERERAQGASEHAP